MNRKLTEATVLETGEKVIPGSIRPDGTVRKERKIRPGYIPQDEQPVYHSRGVQAKQHVPTCPGMDEAEVAALKQQAGKGKKPSNFVTQPPKPKPKQSPPASSGADPAASAPAVKAAATVASETTGTAMPLSEPDDPKTVLEKQVRNLKKKIRQCSDLAEKKQAGAQLDMDQEEKLVRSIAWQEEVQQLEEAIAKLGL